MVFDPETAILRVVRLRQDMVTLIVCAFGFAVLAANAEGSLPSESPYQGIIDRNVFNLRPPPPPDANEPPPPPPPKITLTGITTILGSRQVLFKVQVPPKPPEAGKEKSYMLAEGESSDDIAVIAIDPNAGTVRVNNHGTEELLDISKNGPKPPTASAPPPGPMGQPNPLIPNAVNGTPAIPPGAIPGLPIPTPAGAPGLKTIPMRPLRAQPMQGGRGSFTLPYQQQPTAPQ